MLTAHRIATEAKMHIDTAMTGLGVVPWSPASVPAPGMPTAEDDRQLQAQGAAEDAAADSDDSTELTAEEQRRIEELRQTDRAVRAHEQAHVAAGGQYVRRAPAYDYETGPDGQRYAVGGEVSIDTAPVPGDPEATMRKAQIVQRAALAPVDPSPQDRQVASEARAMEAQARAELLQQRRAEPAAEQTSGEEHPDGATGADSKSPAAALGQRIADYFVAADRGMLNLFA